MTKDYYRILGVLDDAEDVVIRAAFKALAQRYHPDKWTGDNEEANLRMQEINEAYVVLSDFEKRKQYDATLDRSKYKDESDFDTSYQDYLNKDIEEKWKKIVEFLPDLQHIYDDLSNTSKQLAYTYKVLLIEKKNFNQRHEIAKVIENNFLEKYFGKNKKIIQFARELIRKNRKDMAKELNNAVQLLGSDIEPSIIIDKILLKFSDPEPSPSNQKSEPKSDKKELSQIFLRNKSLSNALSLFKACDIEVVSAGWFSVDYFIVQNGFKKAINEVDLINYAEDIAKKILL